MTPSTLKVLLLEDSPLDAELIEDILRTELDGLELTHVDSRPAFQAALGDPDLRLVIADYRLPDFDGLSAMALVRRTRPALPFIMVSGVMGEEFAVQCMKTGATDYLLKSNLKRLPSSVKRALKEADVHHSLREASRVARVVPWEWSVPGGGWIFGETIQEILGYRSERFLDEPEFIRTLIHPEDVQAFIMAFPRARDHELGEFQCRLRHLDGGWMWTHWTVGWAGRYTGVLKDVTELHNVKEALIQSQRLEAMGLMVSGIAHDFGNMLQALGMSLVHLEALNPTELQRKPLRLIAQTCQRAAELKAQLMRVVRAEREPVRVQEDLDRLAHEAVELLRHAIPWTARLEIHPGPVPCPVKVIASQILQVVLNLGINAGDALKGPGTIQVATGVGYLGEEETQLHQCGPGTYAFLEVKDDGPGIPADILPRIFEPFFTTKEPGHGTGLGLAMVRAIVQAHGGILTCTTSSALGTAFRVHLPLLEDL